MTRTPIVFLAAVAMVASLETGTGAAQAAPPLRRAHPSVSPRHRPPARPVRGRPISVRPPRTADEHETQAANVMAQAFANTDCERVGESLRRLSNILLSNARLASGPENGPPTGNSGRDRARREHRQRWQRHFQSRAFWTQVWDRLAETYRQCDMPCFDDGIAIGLMSGTGYCAAAVAVDGLPGPGFAHQPPLPLCENSISVGCQSGYRSAVAEFDGCSAYSTGPHAAIFNEYVSQDCHLD